MHADQSGIPKAKHELEYRRNEEAEEYPVTGFINLGTFEIVRQLADDHWTSRSLSDALWMQGRGEEVHDVADVTASL